jgi:peptidoglycan-associated lipoprotein
MFMFSKRKLITIWIALSLAMFAAGCKKKAPPPPPPPPPAPAPAPAPAKPAAPTVAQFSAEPTTIQRGQSSTLRWEVGGDVTSVTIDNAIGTVQNTGNRRVFPSDSTTYTLTASGPGGSTTASATVSVTSPPPPPPPPAAAAPKASMEQRLSTDVQDAYFDYDKSDVRADARDTLTRDAGAIKAILADFPSASIVVEGHCDERGSAEYNLGLGDRRSSSAKDFLVQLGIPADKVKTISYGKERPQCTESDETCWQKNRRAHFSPGQ